MTTRPATVNFHLYPHATFSEEIVLRDSAGVPIDLTGYTATMHIRREIEDPAPLFALTSVGTTPAIVLGGAAGTIKFAISHELTGGLSIDWLGECWVHDILLTNANVTPNVVDRVFQGRIFAVPGATRP